MIGTFHESRKIPQSFHDFVPVVFVVQFKVFWWTESYSKIVTSIVTADKPYLIFNEQFGFLQLKLHLLNNL